MDKLKDKTTKIGSAARIKRHQILTDILLPSTKKFLSQVNMSERSNVLDIGCGLGETSLLLKSLISSEAHLTCLDTRESQLKIAKEEAQLGGLSRIEFKYQNILEWNEASHYDLVYTRHFFHNLKNPVSMLNKFFNCLLPGGILMVEELDFTKFQCFPNSYAFDRFVELYIEATLKQGGNPNIGSELQQLFAQVGFKNCQTHMVMPSFLAQQNKQLASLTLESISPLLEIEKLANPTELHVLLTELKVFEAHPNTMITLPGIYQVMGYKTTI